MAADAILLASVGVLCVLPVLNAPAVFFSAPANWKRAWSWAASRDRILRRDFLCFITTAGLGSLTPN